MVTGNTISIPFAVNIDDTATIVGISFNVQRGASNASIKDDTVQIEVNYSPGTNKASATPWTSPTQLDYGNSSDLHGLGPIAVADIEASCVVLITAKNTLGTTETAYLDYVELTIHYTLPGGGTATKTFHMMQQGMT
jgi:hypothetical protein